MSKSTNKNAVKSEKSLAEVPVFTTNTLTNYKYLDHDKTKPRLSDTDVVCAKKWVDENHK